MTYTVAVSSTTKEPSHHAKLSDGTTEVGLIFYNQNGNEDELAVVCNPYEQNALKMVSGSQKYDDNADPFMPVAQEDWSGGRGQEDFEEDKTRYFDAGGIDTTNGDQGLVLCGQPTYATGLHTVQEDWMGNVTWRGLYGTSRYVSEKFTTTSEWNTDTITLYAWAKFRRVGSPTSSLYFKIYSNSSSKPNAAVLASAQIPYTQVTDTLGVVLQFTVATGTDLANATDYHVVIYASSDGNATNHWEIACDSASTTSCISANGTDWTVTNGYAPYYRFWSTSDKTFVAHFFTYKDAPYLVTQPDDGTAGKLYINGWRGACDSNSGDLSYTNDATAPGWNADEINGDVVKIIEGGTVYRRKQSWRTITDSTTMAIEVSPDWDDAQLTTNSYVVIGNDKWNQITIYGGGGTVNVTTPITDVAVANGIAYLCVGKTQTAVKFMAYNNNGAWTNTFAYTGLGADLLKVVHDDVLGPTLWSGSVDYFDNYSSDIHKVVAPKVWSDDCLLSGLTLENCQDAWDESDPVSGVTVSKTYYSTVKFAITNTFTTGIIASEVITSSDVRPFNKVRFQAMSTIDLDAGVLQLLLDNTAKCDSPIVTMDFPAMRANVWRTLELDATTNVTGANAIISIGLNCTADQNTNFDVQISGPVRAFDDYVPIDIEGRITGIESYGEIKRPYIFTQDNFGYIDNGYYVPADIPGYKELASEYNGIATGKYDVYLLFSIGRNIARYYEGALDNLGPTNDAGMPSNRKGYPVDIVTFGNQFYVAYDGGTSNYSSVLCYKGNGWHEVFRAPVTGHRIRSLYIQPLPDKEYAKLWIGMGYDVLWIPISPNPYADEDYPYTDEGYLESSYIYTDRRDLEKIFHDLKIFCENVSTNNYYVEADYKLDGDTTWTAVSGDFDTVPSEKINLSSSTPPDSNGKRIRLRYHMITNDSTKTPRIKSVVLGAVAFAETKYSYSFYYRVSEGEYNIDLKDRKDTTFANVSTAIAKLREWSNKATFLSFSCVYAPYDNKTVFIMPSATKPLSIDYESSAGGGREEHLGYLTLLEV